jgi:hypothetical protein
VKNSPGPNAYNRSHFPITDNADRIAHLKHRMLLLLEGSGDVRDRLGHHCTVNVTIVVCWVAPATPATVTV